MSGFRGGGRGGGDRGRGRGGRGGGRGGFNSSSSSSTNADTNNNNNKRSFDNSNQRDYRDRRGPTRAEFDASVLDKWPIGQHFKYLVEKYQALPLEEWNDFERAFRTPLPVTFRVQRASPWCAELLTALTTAFCINNDNNNNNNNNNNTGGGGGDDDDVRYAVVDGTRHLLPQPMAWSGDTAWHTSVSRVQLRKVPGLKKLHRFMVDMEHAGLITRQETVSMVPPMFLDLRPEHAVLDMCASPGSKTSQIIDAMHALSDAPSGYIVANDLDRKRAYMLVHQVLRFSNTTSLVTNHDASLMPSLHLRAADGARVPHFYDRILCDVPCSGEGTIRKNGDVCTKWSPHGAIGFHKIQLHIAKRGAQLLKVGGRLVYSTCSLNPVENEAVVAELLRFGAGALELVDCSAELPLLVRRPGMLRWPVRGYANEGYFDSKADVPEEARTAQAPPSVFAQADCAALHIERCMRFYPHLQDTGGFFVAVLQKTRSFGDARTTAATAAAEQALATPLGSLRAEEFEQPGRHLRERFREDPFVPLMLRSDVCEELRSSFDLSEATLACLSYRKSTFSNNGGRAKPHFVFGESEKLAALVNSGELHSTMLVTNGGMKLFESKKDRNKVDRFRIHPTAATVLLHFFPAHRVIEVTNDELVKLLSERRSKRTDIASFASVTTLGAVLIKLARFNGRPLTSPIGVSAQVTDDMVSIVIEQRDLAALRALLGGIDLAIDRQQLTTPVRVRSDGGRDDDDEEDDDDERDNFGGGGGDDNDESNASTATTN